VKVVVGDFKKLDPSKHLRLSQDELMIIKLRSGQTMKDLVEELEDRVESQK